MTLPIEALVESLRARRAPLPQQGRGSRFPPRNRMPPRASDVRHRLGTDAYSRFAAANQLGTRPVRTRDAHSVT